jgi:DNA-binding NarL/FixJ family response regulator
MDTRTSVFVFADDAVTQAGLEHLLRTRSELYVVPSGEIDAADVAVIGTEEVGESAVRTIGGIQRDGCPKIAVVASVLDEDAIVAAGHVGVLGLLRRGDTTSERLASTVHRVAAGQASVPDDLVAGLLAMAGRRAGDQGGGGSPLSADLTEREQDVIRLLADGCDTSQIAVALCYSERTVKGVIHELTSRLHLRNRSHAVAYAIRNGVI